MTAKNWLVLILFPLCCTKAYSESIADIFNTDNVEFGAVKTPFGLFVTRSEGQWGKSTGSKIYHLVHDTGEFQLADFSQGDFDDSDANYDPSNHRICFVSNRAEEGAETAIKNDNIWCTSNQDDKWQKPYKLPEPVNSSAREFSPAFDKSGKLFFASDRKGGLGQGDIYQADFSQESGWQVRNLGAAINTKFGEWNVGLSPAGDEMIIESSSRQENLSIPGDLYYSRQLEPDIWSKTIPLSQLNSKTSDLMARWFAPEELVFATGISGNMDHKATKKSEWLPLEPSVAVVSRSKGELVLLNPKNLNKIRRLTLGTGPHEIASSSDGRIAISPLFGIYPKPHEKPVEKRPPFIIKPSEGLVSLDLVSGARQSFTLENCPRPHGIDMDAQAKRIWVTCEENGSIVEFSFSENAEQHRYTLDKGIHKVLYLSTPQVLLGTNPDNGKVYKITLKDNQVTSLHSGQGAEGITTNYQGSVAWIANSGDQSVCRLDILKMSLDWCQKELGVMPIALAYSALNNELWVSLFGQRMIVVIDAESGKKLTHFELPHSALDLEYNPDESLIYASIPRLNAVLAISVNSRKIAARFDNVMEADDLDYLPTVLSR